MTFNQYNKMRDLLLVCFVLVILILTVYIKVGNHAFLNYDDPSYVTQNRHIVTGITTENVCWAFTSLDASNWHPITWLSHMADAQVFGMNPRGHHLSSVFFHTASTLLLVVLLFRLTGDLWKSSFVAAIFALHPLHVESVAWVAERKDVLCAFFWFITLLFYSAYAIKRKPVTYLLSLFSFMLGLMSKPMLVTLPIVMLLIDFWPLKRFRNEQRELELCEFLKRGISLVKEKLPFFVCSFISAAVTIYAQGRGGAIKSFDIEYRIGNALIAYVKYIVKILWPHDLAVLYPFSFSFPVWQAFGSFLILLIISVATMRARRQHPYLLVGWLWFLVTLLPVIGLIQVGMQSMADRYTYLPLIGLCIMTAWGLPELSGGLKHRVIILALLACTSITAAATLTWHQVGYWRDNFSLYRHTLQVTKGNYIIHNNLGNALAEKGDLDAAINEYEKGINIEPNFTEAHNNLGSAFARKGNLDAAIKQYQEVIRLDPEFFEAHFNMGNALAERGDLDAATKEYQKTIQLNPDFIDAHNNLGNALAKTGDLDSAIKEYQEAIRLNPDYSKARNNLELALGLKSKQK